MDNYQLGKDIQDIKTRLEKIETALNSVISSQPSTKEDFQFRPIPGLDNFLRAGDLLFAGLNEESNVAERQGRDNDANSIRMIRDIVATAPGKIKSGDASEISRDVARGDYSNAEKTARDAVGRPD